MRAGRQKDDCSRHSQADRCGQDFSAQDLEERPKTDQESSQVCPSLAHTLTSEGKGGGSNINLGNFEVQSKLFEDCSDNGRVMGLHV